MDKHNMIKMTILKDYVSCPRFMQQFSGGLNMKVKELMMKLESLTDEDLGDLEVLDENKIALEDVVIDDHKGEEVLVMCH